MSPASTSEPFFTNATLEQLTEQYPVKATLGGWHNLLRSPDVFNPNYGAAVFQGSPANNREAEVLFGELVKVAAVEDGWMGKRILTELSDVLKGVDAAETRGLLTVHAQNEDTYDVMPTNALLAYVNSRLGALSPKTYLRILQITRREYEVLKAVTSLGYKSQALRTSEVLGVTVSTARNHLANILPKLNVKDTPSAVYAFLQSGEISVEDAIGGNLEELQKSYDMLTCRERGVLSAFAACAHQGDTSSDRIAERLSVFPATVRSHIHNIYGKLGIDKRIHLAIVAYWHTNR